MSRKKGLTLTLMGFSAAMAAAVAMAVTVFACSPLPSVSLSTSSGVPGSQVLLTGERWAPGVPVFIHWDSLTGPLLAQAIPDGEMSGPNVGPVSVRIPADAIAGYHILVATDNGSASNYSRVPIQVLQPSGSTARLPQAVMGTGSTRSVPLGEGVVVLGLLGTLGLAGLALSTASVASLVRTRRERVQVRTSAGPSHRR